MRFFSHVFFLHFPIPRYPKYTNQMIGGTLQNRQPEVLQYHGLMVCREMCFSFAGLRKYSCVATTRAAPGDFIPMKL